jgi:hypothetical protein
MNSDVIKMLISWLPPHSYYCKQLSSVKLHLPLSEVNCFYASCNKILLQPMNAFHVTKKVSILKINSDAFHVYEVIYIFIVGIL